MCLLQPNHKRNINVFIEESLRVIFYLKEEIASLKKKIT